MRVQRLHRRRLGGRRRLDGTGHSFTDLHVRLRDMAEMSSLCSRCVCVARDWSRGQGVLASTEIRGFRTAHFDSPVSVRTALSADRSTSRSPGPLTLALGIWNPPVRVTPFPAGAGRAPGSGRVRGPASPRQTCPPRVSAVFAFSFGVRVPRRPGERDVSTAGSSTASSLKTAT
jgi:hypothetical protein